MNDASRRAAPGGGDIPAGKLPAVGSLLAAHHGCAVLLTEAVSIGTTGMDAVIESAWSDTICTFLVDPGTPVRASLLGAILRRLRADGRLDEPEGAASVFSADHFFLPPDDRWAGWWDVDVPFWPAERTPAGDQVLSAVRRLPGDQRILLLLRDAARLSVDQTSEITGLEPENQGKILDDARRAYVEYLDQELQAESGKAPADGGRENMGGR